MNIFYIDEDPRQCAEWMVDKHVIKMIVETAQLLSTAHRVMDGELQIIEKEVNGKTRKTKTWVLGDHRELVMYNATHINHPSAVWVRQSVENYNWLADHMFALSDEYRYRYNKRHATIEKMGYDLQSPPHKLEDWDWTPMPSVMADEYIVSDNPVENYRNYYRLGKTNLHHWKNRPTPEWI